MNRFKLQAYVSEFPFLSEINEEIRDGKHRDVEFIRIAKVDTNLLNKTPEYEGATGSMVDISTGEHIHFVLSTGEVLRNAVKTSGQVTHNEAHSDDEWWDGESVLEAIDRQGIADKLSYIVVEAYGYDIRDHYSEGGLNFVIYKSPKGDTIARATEEEKAKALSMVQAEANF